jgi:hypothetical protein
MGSASSTGVGSESIKKHWIFRFLHSRRIAYSTVGYLLLTHKGEKGKEGNTYSLFIIYDARLMVVPTFCTLRDLLACPDNTS